MEPDTNTVSSTPESYSPTTAYQKMLAHDTKSDSKTSKPAVTEKKSPPPFDPMLDETENILEDYIGLLGAKNSK